MNSCPYAASHDGDHTLRCNALRQRGAKWDLCIHQFFCRTHGKYKLDDNALKCEIRKEGD